MAEWIVITKLQQAFSQLSINDDICQYRQDEQVVILVEKDKMTYLLSDELFFIFNYLSSQLNFGKQLSVEELYQGFLKDFEIDSDSFHNALDKLIHANIITMD